MADEVVQASPLTLEELLGGDSPSPEPEAGDVPPVGADDAAGAVGGGEEGEGDDGSDVVFANKRYPIEDPGLRAQVKSLQRDNRTKQSQFDRVVQSNAELQAQFRDLLALQKQVQPANGNGARDIAANGAANTGAATGEVAVPAHLQGLMEDARKMDPDFGSLLEKFAKGMVQAQEERLNPLVNQIGVQNETLSRVEMREMEASDHGTATKFIQDEDLSAVTPDDMLTYVRTWQKVQIEEGADPVVVLRNPTYRSAAWSWAAGEMYRLQRAADKGGGPVSAANKEGGPRTPPAPQRNVGGTVPGQSARGNVARVPVRLGNANVDGFQMRLPSSNRRAADE